MAAAAAARQSTGVHDMHGIRQAGAEALPDGVRISGWRIRTVKRPILGEADMEAYQQELGGAMSIPEILFGNSFVELVHEASGAALRFTALDALKGWQEEALPPLKVTGAGAWQKARQAEIEKQNALLLEYDWTYTTPYTGSTTTTADMAATIANGSSANGAGSANVAEAPASTQGEGGDASAAAASCSAPAQWEETEEGMDRDLLQRRDPILFYDDVPLYESEMDDSGVCRCSVKLRVMPRCWFVLLRFWLRVDGCMVRLRETRLFCKLGGEGAPAQPGGTAAAVPQAGQPARPAPGEVRVLKEVKFCEGTFEQVRKAGGPPEGPAYADPDAAAQMLAAMAPSLVTRYHRLAMKL